MDKINMYLYTNNHWPHKKTAEYMLGRMCPEDLKFYISALNVRPLYVLHTTSPQRCD
jgi:hypothetical protein